MASRPPVEALKDAKLPPTEAVILHELIRIYPRSASMAHLVAYLYSYRSDGGPDAPGRVISVYLSRLRRDLRQFGWTVPLARGDGGHSSYRLELLV